MSSLQPHSLPELIQFLDRWQKRHILVVGDFMLDRQTFGHADRLSPDAPVPVLVAQREEHQPGGASNVALDLAALQCRPVCLGVVGADSAGKHLCDALRSQGCDVAGLITLPDRPTTLKHSLIGLAQHRHPQKMFRVDWEDKSPISQAAEKKLLAQAAQLLPQADVLCMEDYNKGVLTESLCQGLIRLAKKHRVPVLVDPAAREDYGKYRGATCITPNRYEAALAAGEVESVSDPVAMPRIAGKLLKTLNLDAVALTLDKHGILLAQKNAPTLHLPTQARAVYDVTGAGDMVLAMMSAAVANGCDLVAATQLGNAAAGLEVEKFGVVPIALDEVLLYLLSQNNQHLGKLRPLDALCRELTAHRRQGKKIAFTNGCFDILHAGHVQFLRDARQQGDLLVVGLNSDRSIRRLKGEGRPVNHEADRVMVLSELESVDYIVVFEEDTPLKLMKAIRPEVIVKGADYKKSEVVGADFVESYGGRVCLVPLVEGRSTTNLIRKIGSASQ